MTHLEPSQANDSNAPVKAHLKPDRICIDVDATFERIIAALSIGPAAELHRLVDHPHSGVWQFAHDPDRPPTETELALDTGMCPTHLDAVDRGDHAVKGLAAARFGVTYTNLSTGGRNYADQHRVIEALSIREPVGITVVDYPEFGGLCLGYIEEPTPGLARVIESYTIPTGHYLATAVSGWGSRQPRAACRIDRIPSRDELAAIPGSRIDRITATCDRCARSWTGEHGSLTLTPDSGDQSARPWDFTKATGHDGASVACPHTACTGRVTVTN